MSAYYEFDEDLEIKLPAGCENASGFKNTHLTIKFHNLSTRSLTTVSSTNPPGVVGSAVTVAVWVMGCPSLSWK